MTDFQRLDDKGVLITGAADGIGLALAEAFAAAGARVFLSDIAAEKVADQAKRLGASSGVCDVSDPDAVAAIVAKAWDEIGPIDLLCANAGVISPGPLLEASRDDIAFQFDVNVWGALDTCRAYVAKLRAEGRGGHILMTGSEHSLSNPIYLRSVPVGVYNLTKHCVLAMGDQLRNDLAGEGIGVSVLCPGPVQSGLGPNSAEFRPDRYGEASAPANPMADSPLDEEAVRRIVNLYVPAAEAAAIAIAGLQRGQFVIPTHPHLRDDATARFQDIEAGFAVLEGRG